ncbi:MAG: alkaline phosphatase family protein [Firmicutes bacterium]|nr:alkaline phosphatase family protein [Bacillota bacterium]
MTDIDSFTEDQNRKKIIEDKLRFAGPDYNNCLVNLSNSIIKRFGAETTANTLPIADEYLVKGYRNVVILLLDALGISTLEDHLEKDAFFRSHIRHTYTSVYPATTVAATTSVLSGLYPNEHGWLGWDMYFPKLDKNVTVFWNKEQMSELEGAIPTIGEDGKHAIWGTDTLAESEVVADFDAASTYIPYTNIIDKINAANEETKAYVSSPYVDPCPETLEKILERIKDLCDAPGEKFIYAYWNEPDSTMHDTGTKSADTHEVVTSLEKTLEKFSSELSDTLMFITADHGHIDSNNLCIGDYPEVLNCLVRRPSIEPRTLNLFVKEECKADFPEIFKRNFGDDFLLLTKEEVLEHKLFGPGENRDGLTDMIGDFVALAISNTSVFNTHFQMQIMPGAHAGLTAEEARIPLIVVES